MRLTARFRLAAAALAGLLPAHAAAQPPAPAAETAQDAAWQNRQSLALAALRWQDGWRVLPDGLRWRPISGDGSGAHPSVSDTVTLHYEGWLVDGTVFDSSFKRGEPATFPLGRLIRGWQRAVPQMGVGDTIEIAIPATLAYGPVGKGPIPGGATLFFKIQLLAIEGKD